MDNKTISFTRRNLPHWDVANKLNFITMRLKGSLPNKVILELKNERELLNQLDESLDKDDAIYKFQRKQFLIIENILDGVNNKENSFLTNDNIAPVLMEAFDCLENKYCWRIPTFIIMSNHIHCTCIADKEGVKISKKDFFTNFKRFTARKINSILNKQGKVWGDENFDHWCRNPQSEASIKKYILDNPIKAGLVKNIDDWKWKK